jgi:hypothetical protein
VFALQQADERHDHWAVARWFRLYQAGSSVTISRDPLSGSPVSDTKIGAP